MRLPTEVPISPLGIAHTNLNCSDLGRSLAAYRDGLGLEALSHTNPPPQDGRGFGLGERAQWDAYILHDGRGLRATALDLLEWKIPAPAVGPRRAANQLGLARLVFTVPDLDAPRPGFRAELPPGEEGGDFRWIVDPDGICVEVRQAPGETRLHSLQINCSDLEHSSAWYCDHLGLQRRGRRRIEAGDARPYGLEGEVSLEWETLGLADNADALEIQLVQWRRPEPCAAPLARANAVGLFRLAFLVEDARRGDAWLRERGIQTSGAVWLDMGPEIPVEGLFANFFPDPDGSCLELIGLPVVDSASRARSPATK